MTEKKITPTNPETQPAGETETDQEAAKTIERKTAGISTKHRKTASSRWH